MEYRSNSFFRRAECSKEIVLKAKRVLPAVQTSSSRPARSTGQSLRGHEFALIVFHRHQATHLHQLLRSGGTARSCGPRQGATAIRSLLALW